MAVLVRSLGLKGISGSGHARSGNRGGGADVTRGAAQAGRTIGRPAFGGCIALPIVRSHAGAHDHGSRSRDRQCSCSVLLACAAEQTSRAQSPETQSPEIQRPETQSPTAQGCNHTFREPTPRATHSPHTPSIAHSARFARAVAGSSRRCSRGGGAPRRSAYILRVVLPPERARGVFSPAGDGASGARVHPGQIQRK
jgi:hypothetical protein